MDINEKFEVKFKDKNSSIQRKLLIDALKDLYINIDDYEVIRRNDSNDQTSKFMDRFFINKNDITTLLEEYGLNLKVTEWGDILADRDRENNLLYIMYIPYAKVGNWDYNKSREKLLYIKWNPINKKIISFHTMRDIQQTNRNELKEIKMRYNEKLSFSQLKAEIVPQSKANANLKYFYKQRNELNGQGNRNIKFLASQFDENDGSMLFAFRTDATYIDEPKKELVNDDLNDGNMKKNTSDEYVLQLKICDFFDILYDLIEPTDINFTKEDMKAILELSNEVRIGCTCPSSYWMGGDYWLTQIDAQLKTCTIAPKFWNNPKLRGQTKICKHELSLLNHISFFLPQMAMACKKELKNYGLL